MSLLKTFVSLLKQKFLFMRKSVTFICISISTVLFFLLISSCRENNQPIKSKSLKLHKKYNAEPRRVSCSNIEKKIFRMLAHDMKIDGYILQDIENWNDSYKNHIKSSNHNPKEKFAVLPENTVWKGIKRIEGKYNRELTEIIFENTLITEVVVKHRLKSQFRPDIKIVQFLFKNKEEAEKSAEKLKLISNYTINTSGLKNVNHWWIHNCAIYFCRTRAAAFSIKPVSDRFEKRFGKVKIMSW